METPKSLLLVGLQFDHLVQADIVLFAGPIPRILPVQRGHLCRNKVLRVPSDDSHPRGCSIECCREVSETPNAAD
jgi:hypothetical protein